MQRESSTSLEDQLSSLNPEIVKLMKIAGTVGLSLGVYRNGERNYYANFGFRDAAAKLPVSEQTVFCGCALTKLFTALSMAIIVDDTSNKIGWNTLIRKVLPDFNPRDCSLGEQMTISDILAHRTGLSNCDFLGSENSTLFAHKDSLRHLNDQVPLKPLREQMQYNNLGYELAGLVIDNVTESWANVFRQQLFGPLGMKRSFVGRPPERIGNVAKAYNTLDDATWVEIPLTGAGEGAFLGSSEGMFTCVEDLLNAYSKIMEAVDDQFTTGESFTKGSPIKQATEVFSAKIPMCQPTLLEASYGFGIGRVQLPGAMGQFGMNPGLMPDRKMPVVAKGAPSRLVFYHQGSLPGALSAMVMIPELQTAVVVMTNSLALNDCADWVMQLVIEQLLDAPQRNDYIAAATISTASTLRWYEDTMQCLRAEPREGKPPRPLEEYVGTYKSMMRHLDVKVTILEGQLYWALQGRDTESFKLDHFDGDTFIWLRPRDYLVARGRWVGQPAAYWKVKFSGGLEGSFTDYINWVVDPAVPRGVFFVRDDF
ncbi:beta-lactamase/transpeptidase-like protein [Xylariaceae sp. FL1651]|nr:beta-lactamase/transpeptidase-like protein [Xylariaceae sp. FL1651]